MVSTLAACRNAPPPAPPNLLLISLDTVRQDVLGSYGHRPRHAPTVPISPALDQLARAGVRMVDAYAPSSWTLPSHLSLLTGRPPLVHAVETEVRVLDPDTPTMAEILRRHGYRTVGIYSAPYLDSHWGFGRGFDEYRPVYGAEVVEAARRAEELRAEIERAAAADWPRYDQLKWQQVAVERDLNQSSEIAVTSERVAAAARERLALLAREGKPWFLFAHFFDAHCDYAPPPPYDTRFDPDYRGSITGKNCLAGAAIGTKDPDRPGRLIRQVSDRDLEHVYALYEGEVAWVDSQVETILAGLDSMELARRTLVVVLSDHGEEFFEHGAVGHRHTLYEESVRVPMLLRLPGTLPEAAVVRGPVSLTDVLPTILDILGLPAVETPGGSSFLPLIRGREDATRRTVTSRLVTMIEGEADVDGTHRVTFRQIGVEDVFREGPTKITRRRSWPQFPNTVAPDLRAILEPEAAAQYTHERLRWIDLDRFPDEPEGRESEDFSDPAVRATLDHFRERYTALARLRSARPRGSALPERVRRNLEALGYLDSSANPAFSEPDVTLPPPGGSGIP